MNKSSISIPVEMIPEFEEWGKLTARIFGRLREKEGLVPKGVPDDQKWFWSKEWQAMEREADEALATGEYVEFDNMDEAIEYLHKQV